MDCLNNLIGIGKRESSTSESLYYLDSPNINIRLEDADAINNGQRTSGKELLDDLIETSQREFKDEFILQLRTANPGRKIFTANSVLENGVIGYYRDNLPKATADSTRYRGISIKVRNYPYVSLHIGELRIMSQSTGDIDVLVYDLIENRVLDTLTISAVADQVSTLTINKTYPTKKQMLHLAFLFDATTATYASNLQKEIGCLSCKGQEYYTTGGLFESVEFAKSGQIIQNNKRSGQYGTGGLSIQYSLNCDIEPFICSIKNQLALPLLYKVAVNFCRQAITSVRINSTNKIPPEAWEERLAWYQTKYEDVMGNIINGIQVQDKCFQCEPSVTKVVRIP